MISALLLSVLLSNDPGYVMHPSVKSGGTITGDLTLNDNVKLCMGAGCDYWLTYNSTNTRFEFWTSDSDGAGADLKLKLCDDGGTACTFSGLFTATGGFAVNADNVNLTLGASGATDSKLYFDATDLRLYSSGSIRNDAPMIAGPISVEANSYMTLINVNCTSAMSDGDDCGYRFTVDNSPDAYLDIVAKSDGADDVDTFDLKVPSHTVDYVITAAGAFLGPSSPTEALSNGSCHGLGFDAAGETVDLTFEIPSCWAGATSDDILIKVYWCPTSTDTPQENEEVDWEISYRVLDWGTDATTTGSAVVVNGEWIAGASETDTKTYETSITLDADDSDQPLVAGEVISMEFNRDTANEGSSYSGNAIVQLWEVVVPQTSLLCNHQN